MNKLPSGIDLTNKNQKLFALALLAGVLYLLYHVVPPLVVLFQNLWLLVLYGGSLLFLAYNYDIVWHWFKRASWELTKWSINKDKPGYLYRFHAYLVKKNEDLKTRLRNLKATRENVKRQMLETKSFIDTNTNEMEQALRSGATGLVASYQTKIKLKQGLLDKLVPRYEFIKSQEEKFTNVVEIRTQEAEDLKFSIDAKIAEYDTLKQIDKAISAAGAAADENSHEYQLYRESLRQMEDAVVTYTANLEMFDIEMKPALERAAIQKDAQEDEAQKLIDAYRANVSVDFKQLAQLTK